MSDFEKISERYKAIQDNVCERLEKMDGGALFSRKPWVKAIGNGVTSVLTDGKCLEKAAVNFSSVQGVYGEEMAKLAGKDAGRFMACGVSSIIHPMNPLSPIIHLNIRYFQLESGDSWFGGGMDLTPHYVDKSEARQFHRQLKNVCDKFDASYYEAFKKQADDYYYLPHRQETRGIGGVFFDHLTPTSDLPFQKLMDFTICLGETYPELYINLLQEKRNLPYGLKEKTWQNLRRGRYVEFNLIQDRGTKFGLASGGNTESILVSMPPLASWEFDVSPEENSEEFNTLQMLKKGIDWINIK